MINIENFTKEKNLRGIGVYMIEHKDTTLKYIGSTYQKYGFKQRWLQHLNGLKKGKGNKVLLNIYYKYGIENFSFKILEDIENIDTIREKESYWINYYNTYNKGANCSNNTHQSLLGRKTKPLTEKHKYKLHIISKTKKKVYLYDIGGNLKMTFSSSVKCDRYFNLKKGRTSYIISNKSNMKRISRKYFPSYKLIKKEDWNITFGNTQESRKQAGLKHKGKVISKQQKEKARLSNKNSIKVELFDLKNNFVKNFNSLNECDDFLNLTRGSSSKHLKGITKTLKRKYILKITR